MAETLEPRFACDAMLGGLARWLRAAGYDSSWSAAIADWELIRMALREERTLLTCDTGIFRIGIVRDGEVPALLLPQGLHKQEQLAFILCLLNLPLRAPRCMACGGPLLEVPKEQASPRVPPRTLAWLERFYECSRCGQFFWQGTHWQQIAKQLEGARTGAEKLNRP